MFNSIVRRSASFVLASLVGASLAVGTGCSAAPADDAADQSAQLRAAAGGDQAAAPVSPAPSSSLWARISNPDGSQDVLATNVSGYSFVLEHRFYDGNKLGFAETVDGFAVLYTDAGHATINGSDSDPVDPNSGANISIDAVMRLINRTSNPTRAFESLPGLDAAYGQLAGLLTTTMVMTDQPPADTITKGGKVFKFAKKSAPWIAGVIFIGGLVVTRGNYCTGPKVCQASYCWAGQTCLACQGPNDC